MSSDLIFQVDTNKFTYKVRAKNKNTLINPLNTWCSRGDVFISKYIITGVQHYLTDIEPFYRNHVISGYKA